MRKNTKTLLGIAAAGGAAALGYWWWSSAQGVGSAAPDVPDSGAGQGGGTVPGTGDKTLAAQLATQLAADLNDKGKAYSHALCSSFQRADGTITVDGKYGNQTAAALAKYVPDAPPGLQVYGGPWDGLSSPVPLPGPTGVHGAGGLFSIGGTPPEEKRAVDNLVELDRVVAQRELARQILATPDGQERRYLVACFQRGNRLPVTGQLGVDPDTLRKIREYAG